MRVTARARVEEFYRILVSGIVVLARENGDERRKATKRCPGFMI